ncbi:MAG: rhomboid family intramembrane serine protease [Albidovulum sp.]|uniref:rhomboid family intramembrane serine protease n=1 Tax=Albidovulum sp. TaxID=1872424 RepID=UPI00132771B7|nr:rhomboid family intramembrane serine protease [Defluviimonas sp.]KAB2877572.1 MAG: rhomboid family intramembrane serine protease [Defluviimonas sp.]
MFPIRDHNPSHRTPFVVYALIAVNVLIFLVQLPYMADERALAGFWADRALYPALVTEHISYTGILTSMFLHAGWMHIIGNMLFLWIFGDNLEDQMGHVGFLVFYLASGIAAAFAHIYSAPDSAVPTVGASGAIAGVMGGYLLMFPRARVDILVIIVIFIRILTLPAWVMLGLWFALQVFSGVSMPVDGGGVAFWAHAGGFVAGLVLALPLWLRRGGPGFWARTHGLPPHPETVYSPSRIPTVRRRR